ncbi:MAG: tRNA (guanosine(46)-N7)-methyltransferase TrmB [Mycoplasma sp.]|nr:tRNA (guanosine(46)-N7)-methyltransferase TrmB [Mycoplasma sp.]
MRLRNDPKSREYLDSCPNVIKNFPIKVNEKTILEIGMGKGEMLCELATINKELVYIGVEKFPTVAAKAAKRSNLLNLKNFYIICSDIEDISDGFDGTISELWLTFSDPWPKKRHYKRRLTYKKYLDIYKKLLSKDGILKIKTDNDDFFNWSIEQIQDYNANILFLTNDLHNSVKNNENVKTGYEIKWSKKGKNINYMEVKF